MAKRYKPTGFMLPTSHYDKARADHAVNFIQSLKHTKGVWAGQPFILFDWQEQIIRDLFGIIKPNGYRQFNTAFKVGIPKGFQVRPKAGPRRSNPRDSSAAPGNL